MNQATPLPFLESTGTFPELPFSRYLPLCSPGVIPNWLRSRVPPGSWVLEPIGASPQAVLEIALAGYKVLTSCNNPVVSFALSLLARAPTPDDFQAAIAELSHLKRGSERLETHILNLYQTRCASCGKELSASGFFWHRGALAPHAKIYICPVCGDSGEHPVTDEDVDRLTSIQRSDPLHRALALERVPGGTKEARINLEEALESYTARPIYALFTLINKVEGLSLGVQKRELMDALLLSALDAGHTLWPNPSTDERPRVLNTPAVYFEKNLWMALENGVGPWTNVPEPLPLCLYPLLPEGPGICLFPGRARDLLLQNPAVQPESTVCVLPRPNQAFWTLSTLWSSWLWGKEHASSLKNVLERQRFDWYWHANALQSALSPAARLVEKNTPLLTLLGEPATGFVTAAVEAASASGWSFGGVAYKNDEEAIQLEWRTNTTGREFRKVKLRQVIRETIRELLTERGEPCSHLLLHTAVCSALAYENALPANLQQLTFETTSEIQSEISKVFSDKKFLCRLDATSQDLESGFWWLAGPENSPNTLTDRIETELVTWLQKEKSLSSGSIRGQLNQRFPGFSTPPDDLLVAVLLSYADLDPQGQTWKLKEQEFSACRKRDLEEIRQILQNFAAKFDLDAAGENPILWSRKGQTDSPIYRIFLSASALVSRFTRLQDPDPVENIFLFPGSRSALLQFKLDQDPHLRKLVSSGWHFLKFRTLREMNSSTITNLDLWAIQLESDPIHSDDTIQLRMFGR
ncbi:MAG: hypothetical protein NTZ74_01935 [Chloroflexi bacterium]|nr:hypothetical protein [Chloroflexota bacterium]